LSQHIHLSSAHSFRDALAFSQPPIEIGHHRRGGSIINHPQACYDISRPGKQEGGCKICDAGLTLDLAQGCFAS
jgi:hypothetical protein